MTNSLGRLEKIELREAWNNEARDFTPWLAQEENLALLAETIGIELELEGEEKSVGPFSADILCKDVATGDWVLIENQLERTDHTHLGQLITYSAGLDAVKIVWIAHKFTDEHRAALNWLNEISSEGVNFFGLEIELWKIGDSPFAPKFNVVCKPNDWSKTVREVANKRLTETQETQLEFWTEYKEFLERQDSEIKPTKPGPQHWMRHPFEIPGCNLASILSKYNSESNSFSGEVRAEMVFDNPMRSKEDFAALEAQKEDIERELGEPLTWHNPANATVSKVYIRRDGDIFDRDLWKEYMGWLIEKNQKLIAVLEPRILRIRIEADLK